MSKDNGLKRLGVIPDGNRRYARKNNISYRKAYKEGFNKLEQLYKWCLETSIDEVVFYALSTENLKRKDTEIDLLFKVFRQGLDKFLDSDFVHKNKINIEFLGRKDYVEEVLDEMNKVENATANYEKNSLKVCIGYGGRKEIIDSVKKVNEKDLELNEENLSNHLYYGKDLDLVLRTGGYQRLSNFMLWQNSYAELFFSDHLWPELDRKEFEKAVDFYESTKRKFGK